MTSRRPWPSRLWRLLLLACLLWNGLAIAAVRAATHFAGEPAPPGTSSRPSWAWLPWFFSHGLRLPRPSDSRTPADLGWRYERHVLAAPGGPALEAWWVPHEQARGAVALFHGHAACKAQVLREARLFRSLGYSALLVDFRASGGSAGELTSIGWHEADDVRAALAHVRRLQSGPVVLYGTSMGAAAVLKAAHEGARAEALVVESPFDNLRATLAHRFEERRLPATPAADTMLAWGGLLLGIDPFRHNPSEYAADVWTPTLAVFGGRDPYVHPDEAARIHAALRGPKRLHVFEDLGHASFAGARPQEWRALVGDFLRDTAGLR